MIWNCVEDRVDNGTKYGKIIKKVIFGQIYLDRSAILSGKPLQLTQHLHLKVEICFKLIDKKIF